MPTFHLVESEPPRTLAAALNQNLEKMGSPMRVASSRSPFWADTPNDGWRWAQLVCNDLESVNVSLWQQGVELSTAWVSSVEHAARALHTWLVERASMEAVARKVPEMPVKALALAHEQGAAAYVEAVWQARLASVDDYAPPRRHLAPVLRAASRLPGLRQLLPYTSVHRLCFSRCTGFPFSYDCPLISPTGPWDQPFAESFEVYLEVAADENRSTVRVEHLGHGTAEWAAALAAKHLPAHAGPAVHGTLDDLRMVERDLPRRVIDPGR